ncbi:hypothetical protein FB639_000487 [Coemansia asiatica]|nr:hypothetical protein FB639_000487 [Coemansia asiatica]
MDCRALHLNVQYLDQFLNDVDQPVDVSHLKHYAIACLFVAKVVIEKSPRVKIALPANEASMPETDQFKQALKQVAQSLDWCLEMFQDNAGNTFKRTADLPTMIDFLLSFQRAAIELPERFADTELVGEDKHGGKLDNDLQTIIPRQFDIGPFAKTCRLANALLRDQDCLLFHNSELAAVCFFIAAQPEGIDLKLFQKYTGHTLDSVQPAIVYSKAVCEWVF